MWPNSRISVMGGEQAAMVLTTVQKGKLARSGQTMPPEMEEAIKAPIIERYVEICIVTVEIFDKGQTGM